MYYFFTYSVLLTFRMELLFLVRTGVGHLPNREVQGWPLSFPSLKGWVIGLLTVKDRNLRQRAVLEAQAGEGPWVSAGSLLVPPVEFPSGTLGVQGLQWLLASPWGGESLASECGIFGQTWQGVNEGLAYWIAFYMSPTICQGKIFPTFWELQYSIIQFGKFASLWRDKMALVVFDMYFAKTITKLYNGISNLHRALIEVDELHNFQLSWSQVGVWGDRTWGMW